MQHGRGCVRAGRPSAAQRVAPAQRAHSWLYPQALDHIIKYMGDMKTMLYGDAATDKAPKDEDGKLLTQEAAKSKLLTHMCSQLLPLDFEARPRAACAWFAPHADTENPCVCARAKDAQRRGAGVQRLATALHRQRAALHGLPAQAY